MNTGFSVEKGEGKRKDQKEKSYKAACLSCSLHWLWEVLHLDELA